MNPTTLFCGIDISSATIEVCLQKADGSFYNENLPNSTPGFKKLLQLTKGHAYHFVMESTGIYHLSLCLFLEKKRRLYSVANPLQVKMLYSNAVGTQQIRPKRRQTHLHVWH